MTGNRNGISRKAMKRFQKLLDASKGIEEGHHGGCRKSKRKQELKGKRNWRN